MPANSFPLLFAKYFQRRITKLQVLILFCTIYAACSPKPVYLLFGLWHLQSVISKAKKIPKQSPGFKTEMEAFEEKLLATAAERKEEEATAQVRTYGMHSHHLSMRALIPFIHQVLITAALGTSTWQM